MNAPEFSVVIPVYNEKDNLPELIDRCLAACKKTRRSFEIIPVDDGSSDGSRDIISRAAERYPEVVAVILNRNYGQHAAVFAGLDQSKGEIVVTLDADGRSLDMQSAVDLINRNPGKTVLIARDKNMLRWRDQLPQPVFQDENGPSGYVFWRY
jgi:glycosyltransferase involved in cell wall biosynthesis